MTINSRTVGSLRYMKNHLVVWGEKWCPSKDALRSSAGEQGQLLADGTYTSVPETPSSLNSGISTPAVSSSRSTESVAGLLPTDLPKVPAPFTSPSPYLHPPSLEDAECMFGTPVSGHFRPHVSDAQRHRRLRRDGRRRKRHSLARASAERGLGLGRSSTSRHVYENPAMESNLLLRSHETLGVATPYETPSRNEPNQHVLAPLELDTYLSSHFPFPSQEACGNGPPFMGQPSEPYTSSYDFPSGVSAPRGSSELMGRSVRGGFPLDTAVDRNGSFADCPYGYGRIEEQQGLPATYPDLRRSASAPFPLTSHYQQTMPFKSMPPDGMYPLHEDMSFGGLYSNSTGHEYMPTVSGSHLLSTGDDRFLSAHLGHHHFSPKHVRNPFTDSEPSVPIQASAPDAMAPNSFQYDQAYGLM